MARPLWWRVGSLLFIIQAAVLALIAFLNYSNYRSSYEALHQTRYLVIGKDLRQAVESGLDIGLGPAENVQLATALAVMREQHPALLYVAVTNVHGDLLAEHGTAPSSWAPYAQDGTPDFRVEERTNRFRLRLPYVNNFKVVSGELLIDYDKRDIRAATDTMLNRLVRNAAVCAVIFGGLIWLGCYLLTRRNDRELADIVQALEKFQRDPTTAIDLKGTALGDEVHAFVEQYQQADQLLYETEQRLQQQRKAAP